MRKIIFLFFIFINGICVKANPISVFSDTIHPDKTRMLKDLQFLVKSPIARYDEHVERLNECAKYIFDEFKKLTEDVEEQKYMLKGKEYKNIICSFGPKEGERIIVGAHYDVCENQPGADDNASGVAGMLEIARLISSQSQGLKYRVDFVAYTLEEPPNFRTANMGSAVHAKMLFENHVKVKQMICLEMIGFFSDKRRSQEYPIGLMKLFYPTKANYIALVGKIGQGKSIRSIRKEMRENSEIKVCSINSPAFVSGIDFSDHLNYWKYGYPAVMITDTAFYRNPNYHEKTDTLETLNIDKIAEVVKGVFASVVSMS